MTSCSLDLSNNDDVTGLGLYGTSFLNFKVVARDHRSGCQPGVQWRNIFLTNLCNTESHCAEVTQL